MFRILEKTKLAPRINRFWVEAPRIARKARAGQFIIIRIHEHGERVPLTIADADPRRGAIMLVFLEMGKTTRELATYEVGDAILDILGPLGIPLPRPKEGTIICVGGGVGVAPIYPRARELKAEGHRVIGLVGARSKELTILRREMESVCDEVYYCTNDGSLGHQGLVTDLLPGLIEREKPAQVVAVGPVPMMQSVAETTRPYGVPTVVSLNALMVDGTGMCGACRVTVGGQTRFTCVDGPEFDGHQVDFAELMNRLCQYREQEKAAVAHWEQGGGECRCQTR